MRRKRVHAVATAAALMAITVAAAAQQPTFKRTELQRADLSAPGREVVQAIAEIPAGVSAGRHTHPGEEVGYVLEGAVLVEIDGKPASTLKAGQVLHHPRRGHSQRNQQEQRRGQGAGDLHHREGKAGGDPGQIVVRRLSTALGLFATSRLN